ncbi:mediator complex subunit [Ascosphaera atra]|nr:mediator complex subunit [Ascosphaera atra]
MLAGRPLIDDGLLSAYLRNRYGGNLMTIVDELITAAFDILANGKWRKEHQQNMFLLQTFLINKVPSFLQQMASSVQPIPMELAISRALARIDPNTFPSFSQMFSMQGSSALSDVRQEFLFSCALHRLIPEASIERLLGENPMQSLPSGGQMSRNDVSSQIIQHTDRLEQLLNKMESMDGNASIIAVALTDALKHFCEKNDATSLKRICVAVAKRPQVLDVIMLFNQPTDFLGPLNSLLCSWEWRGSGGRKQEYEAFGSIFLFILAFYYRFELTPADLNTTDETFIMKLLGDGQTAHHLDDLTKEQNEHVGSWIEAFFVSEGITDGSIKTDPREFYMLED